jgi:hypothetical protein
MWNRCKTKGPYYMPLNSVVDPHHVDAVPDEDSDTTNQFLSGSGFTKLFLNPFTYSTVPVRNRSDRILIIVVYCI